MSANIAKALHEVMKAVGYVQKTGRNEFHRYSYAGEADLLEVLRPAMVEAGLILLPSVRSVTPVDEYGNVTVIVDYMLIHKDGDIWPEKISAAGMGNDKAKNGSVGDKGVYKAITGANKYLLFKLFQIETGDDPEQVNAVDTGEAVSPSKPLQQEKPVEVKTLGKNEEARALFQSLREDMIQAQSLPDLKARWIAIQDDLKKLPTDWRKDVEDLKDSVKADMDKNGAPPQGFKSAQASLDGLPQDKYTPADYLRAGE